MVAIGHVSRHHFAAAVWSTVQLTSTAASGIAINNENSFHSCSVRLGFGTSKVAPSFEKSKLLPYPIRLSYHAEDTRYSFGLVSRYMILKDRPYMIVSAAC